MFAIACSFAVLHLLLQHAQCGHYPPSPFVIREKSGGSDNGNCTKFCQLNRRRIATYLTYFDYDFYRHVWSVYKQYPEEDYPKCKYTKLDDAFYTADIFARSRADSLNRCINTCLRVKGCSSVNYVPSADSCYMSRGPYLSQIKTLKKDDKLYYRPKEFFAHHYYHSCATFLPKPPKRPTKHSYKLKPGNPYFTPKRTPHQNVRTWRTYQILHSSPWMVNVKVQDGIVDRCSAVLIPSDFFNGTASNLVLTSAQCATWLNTTTQTVEVEDVKKFEFQFGKNHLHIDEWSLQTISADRIVVHEAYNGSLENGYDLALFKLTEPVKFNRFILPISWPRRSKPLSHAECYTTGWKMRPFKKHYSFNSVHHAEKFECPLLQRIDTTLAKDSECRHLWNETFNNNTMHCVKLPAASFYGCKVDIGAPLTCFEDGVYSLYGIATVKPDGSCRKYRYSYVTARISVLQQWIKSQDQLLNQKVNVPAATDLTTDVSVMGNHAVMPILRNNERRNHVYY